MTIELELQIASDAKTLPHPSQFREWISVALSDQVDDDIELTIRIVDKVEMSELNEAYRNKKGPTNVLSFPGSKERLIKSEYPYLGDIVICAPIIEKEAKKNNIDLLAHWAHIVIHGALHLLGYDHQISKDAKIMESLETKLLVKLGFPPPYGELKINE